MMISDEAVEAAAKASWEKDNSDPWISGDHDDLRWHDRRVYLDDAKLMLEAAEPYMRSISAADIEAVADMIKAAKANGWDEGRKHGARYPYGERGLATDDNPYRSQS